MATNQYLPWAISGSANVLSYSAYAARGELLTGVVPGVADDTLANTTWRQSTVIASAVAQFIVENTNLDMLDDGNVEGIVVKLKSALANILVTATPPLYAGQDTSTNSSTITANLQPAMATYAVGGLYVVRANNTNTGAVQVSFNGLPTVPLVDLVGAALAGANYASGSYVLMTYNGSSMQLLTNAAVTSTITLNVPSPYATIQAAMVAASVKLVASNANIVIAVAAGNYTFTSITGGIYISHPFGQRISIIGATMSGAFPVRTDIAGKSNSLVQTMLQGRFQTVITVVGTNAIELRSAFGTIQNILFIGDGTTSGGHYGLLAGCWSGDPGFGYIGLRNVAFHNFGLDCIRAEQSSLVQCNNVICTYATRANYWVSHKSVLEVNVGSVLGFYGQYAASVQNDGAIFIDSASGSMDLSYSTSHNIYLIAYGEFNALPATGLLITNAGGYGVYAFAQALCNLPSQTSFSGNTSGDVFYGLVSIVTALGASVGTATSGGNGATFFK